jgi:Cdc6-like AAA superfamily ATPase
MDLDQAGKKRDFRVRAFVGREKERRELDAALGRALRFEAPQFVTLVGENGLGKTRLVQEWCGQVRAKGEFRVYCAAGTVADDGVVAPFSALAALLRQRFAIADDMDDSTALATSATSCRLCLAIGGSLRWRA